MKNHIYILFYASTTNQYKVQKIDAANLDFDNERILWSFPVDKLRLAKKIQKNLNLAKGIVKREFIKKGTLIYA